MIVLVEVLNHLSHVSNGVRVGAHTKDHPEKRHYLFNVRACTYISVSNGEDGLESPVEGNEVLLVARCVNDTCVSNPAIVREVKHLGLKEPEAGHQVVEKEYCTYYRKHLFDTFTYFQHFVHGSRGGI